MFRGYMPALTLGVFAVGLGFGFACSSGFIPLTYSPAKSGSLEIDPREREPLPPPEPSRSVAELPDDEVFENQTEPEVSPHDPSATRHRATESPATLEDSEEVAALTPATTVRDTAPAKVDTSGQQASYRPDRRRQRNVIQTAAEEVPEEVAETPRRPRVAAVPQPKPTAEEVGGDPASPPPSTTASPQELLLAAEEKLANGDTLPAHREMSSLYWKHKDLRPSFQDALERTAQSIFFQSKPHYIDPYVIQEGERLETIARKYQLTWEYLAKLNRTDPRRIQIGQKLKVMKGPFGAVVDLNDYALTIHLHGYFVKRYSVGIGKNGASPVGKFTVLNKVENPAYTDPNGKVIPGDDPSNPLGERWIDLGDSYGIHGTIDPDSIGKAESRGCIRLRDADIIEVYNFLVKGSEVVIRK